MGKDQKNSPAARQQKQKKAARKVKAMSRQQFDRKWSDRLDFGIKKP